VVVLPCKRKITSCVWGGVTWLSHCVWWDAGAVWCPRVLLRSLRPGLLLVLPRSDAWLPLLDWLQVKLEVDDIILRFWIRGGSEMRCGRTVCMRERVSEDAVCLFFEAGRAALPQPLPLRSFLYLLSFAPGLFTSLPSLSFWREDLELGLWPGLSTGADLSVALAPTLGCARALLLPGPVPFLQFKLLAQAQGFGHHLPSLQLAKLLALASQ
jgi:hypothetical protein